MGTKVAVVTGGNKGIGLAIVRGLCKSFNGDVYLTSRDIKRGEDAVEVLKKENLNPKFFQLDVTNKDHIIKLKELLLSSYGGLDLLINNAAVYKEGIPSTKDIDVLMDTNYFSVVNICDVLFPILKQGARVVHVSSGTGNYALSESAEDVVQQLVEAKSVKQVSHIMQTFVNDVKDGTWNEKGWINTGWINTAYGVSKAGLIMITPIQQRIFDNDASKVDIIVNSCCPGYVDTDMARAQPNADMFTLISTDDGADTPLYLALLPENTTSPRGGFCRERKLFRWDQDPVIDKVKKFLKK